MNLFETDVLIVGAGPAGLASAIELRKRGVGRVTVVVREREPGGIPRHSDHIGFGLRDMHRFLSGPAYAARYVRLAERAGVDIEVSTTITGWQSETHLTATRPDGLAEFRASAVVLATGCRERPRSARLIPGSRPAGILTTGALQNFVYIHHHPVGKRALVVGADHVGFSAVMTLKHAGADVLGIVTEFPQHQSYFQYKLVSADRYRVPLLTNQKVTNIFGKKRVEAVELTDVRSGAIQTIACDTLVFTGGWIPDYELAFSGGLQIDPNLKGPRINLQMQTSAKGVFAAGNLIHAAETADVAAISGRLAAAKVQDYLNTGKWCASSSVPIDYEAPIAWASPQAIDPGAQHAPHGHFILRVSDVLQRPTLLVKQEGRVLWQKSYRSLLPNLPIYVPDGWLKQLNSSPARFEIRL
jgi:NADPH-dependent 2,4-dienoyl-CoA reductase/sulfur reductase-like enzyme